MKIQSCFIAAALWIFSSLHATTNSVSLTTTSPTTSGTLPYWILNSKSGDTIDCAAITNMTITLTESLPAITQSALTITNSAASGTVTIAGGNAWQAFSVASGIVTISNMNITDAASEGGAGGSGLYGGGGGCGGGGALYVPNGATVLLDAVQMMGCTATGGAGGATTANTSGGGGGGGFGGNVGGNGTTTGGGGGGGNSGGGAGGNTGSAGSTGTFFGGGGGGSPGNAGGTSNSNTGGSANAAGGGGGAGAGGAGVGGTTAGGGNGGIGLGTDQGFGSGGGGGSTGSSTAGGTGVAGTGGGGGGGPTGGAGGLDGGGGGGGTTTGGAGGFGAGGGAAGTTVGTSLFGGGSGTSTTGGPGASLGGAIFVQNSGTLVLQDSIVFSGNMAEAVAGAMNLGNDIFLRSGGTLIVAVNAAPLTISSAICSDQGAGGGTGGGLNKSGTNTLTLTGANTYSGGTAIAAGTLNISADDNLGQAGQGLTIGTGTLQAGASFTISSARAVSLTAAATFDSQANALTVAGVVSGGGSLTKVGSGSLSLTNTNTYLGGTTISAGTLITSNDAQLGSSSGILTIGAGTWQLTSNPFTSARAISLTGAATIDPQTNTATLSGNISGSGSLTKASAGTLILTGTSSYSGGTTVSAGTLQGSTSSLQGSIAINSTATLLFSQAFNGTYSGVLSGSGQLGSSGTGVLQITGASPSFTGTGVISAGTLQADGNLGSLTSLTIQSGATLIGTGTVANVTIANGGEIDPGDNNIGTLTINGTLMLGSSATTAIQITPTTNSKLTVGSTATLNGALSVAPATGFYAFGNTYTILTAGTSVGGTFSSTSSTDSNFIVTVVYNPTSVVLDAKTIEPFLNFPYANKNEKAVGENINALAKAGAIPPGSPLYNAINTLAGKPNRFINQALNDLHPAQYSAFAESQVEVGAELLAAFLRRPKPACTCCRSRVLWGEPYGVWQKQQSHGEQLGFEGVSKGVAFGTDCELVENWIVGIGGVWNDTHLTWVENHGEGKLIDWYGAFYTDYMSNNFYIGATALGGRGTFRVNREINFVGEHAHSYFRSINGMAQLTSAYFFGGRLFCLFPYATVDYFYLNPRNFSEKGAPGLNLTVSMHHNTTLRPEVGVGMQIQDINRFETACLSPLMALGWSAEYPLHRSKINAEFEDQTIPFRVRGWNHNWQMFFMRFGLNFTYRALSLGGNYHFEFTPDDHTTLYVQRGNFRAELSW